MAKPRKKKRTHVGASGDAPQKANERGPKSMVIRIGASDVGPSVSQLVKDVRTMMEPDTASRLQERRNNRLRDYTTMAGPLGVTHLLLFSRSKTGNTNMRLAVTPRGPTLHFRVEEYSLCKDVHQSQKRPKSSGVNGTGKEGVSPPLLVMNNFTTSAQQSQTKGAPTPHVPKHLESLSTTVFQSLFPAINPTTTPLNNIKRILLLDRAADSPASTDHPTYTLDLRHYAIETRTAKSVPKPLRRLDAAQKLAHAGQKRKRGDLPNLGRLNDVADYLLDPHAADGFTSGSDSEPETDAEVEVLATTAQKVQQRDRRKGRDREDVSSDRRDPESRSHVERRGIKLQELGPRLRLRLTKIEEGLCTGKVMWHEYIHKTAAEEQEMERVHEERRAEKERRREEQRARVEAKKKSRGAGEAADDDAEDEDELSDDDEWDDEEDQAGAEEEEEEEVVDE
ncbi:Brix domain-containing protein [Neohortaea acidophila]|uniref:Brix domain-containing protein n=1 Tax=Neohortaea acidophila TaxID=245834 RepID=A0A6A6Q6V1_9PEZI|nr:Brix domain-containing protein [Neohortaea acidophila]KAF2488012.1 Brix domain-containing protein [Neohortaea acidophila]